MKPAIVKEKFALGELTTFALPAVAACFAEVTTLNELNQCLDYAENRQLEVVVMGEGSNLVFMGDYPGMVIKVSLKGIQVEGRSLRVAAGENWHETVTWALSQGLYGLENLSYIPGTAGAAPVQNIGAYGVELAQYLEWVRVLDRTTGKIQELDKKACEPGYRDSIFKGKDRDRFVIIELSLGLTRQFEPILVYDSLREELDRKNIVESSLTAMAMSQLIGSIRQRKLPDPSITGNAGSFFKNPVIDEQYQQILIARYPAMQMIPQGKAEYKVSAAWLIENAGLKGLTIGQVGVSEKHSLVLVNHGAGSARDLAELLKKVTGSVNDLFGIELEPEPRMINCLD